ncbi:ACHAB-like protein [Mya arenaria]|uniref:ACHAB-like protein n=1 Tax=Mya arenaria TaxID=6604 RepID=A0ABY7FKK2_MYAAR|nr:acetylcholine receptor subunit alpha-1-B-like [Mya arenaria]WAR22112.1 ACHAB-like protein [Mya arenaria]
MKAVLVCISFICITNVFVHSKKNNKPQCNIQTKTVKNKLFPLVGKSREKRQTCKEYRVVHTNFRTYFKSLMANYSNYVPPYYPSKGWQRDENFVLDIRMQPEALVDLNDVDERMTTVLSFLVEWKESNLVWAGMNTFVYSVILDADMLWKPHIKVGNPHTSQRVKTDTNDKLTLEFKGEVTWSFVWTVDTRCKIDITYYPFDRQYCLIVLVLSSDLKDYLNFDHTVPHLALDNGNWKHMNTSIYNYTNYKTMKTHIVIEYTFDRKSVTPMLVFMAPVTILVSLSPLVFVLPNDGSERLGIAMTVLLAVSVYMTLVVDKLPDSSDPLPLITTVFFAWYVYNAFVTLLVLINGRISRISDKRSVPKCLQCLVR